MKKKWILIFLLLLKFSLPFLLSNPAFELHRDEYLYYEQGKHLAFGYLENPPLIGLLAYLSSLFGGGFFWIKFWPSLFGVLTMWFTVRTAKQLGGGFYAQIIAAIGMLFSAYLRTHFLFQPNFLDIFFWTVSAYFLVRYINTQQTRFIYYLAFSLALGWYGKYSVLFFILSLLLSLLLTHHRAIFLRKQLWTAVALAIIFISPNIVWQYLHRWPLVHHMQELQETQLQHLNRLDFIKEQILMLLPVAFLWIGGLVWTLKSKAYRVIGYCYLGIVLLLIMGSGKGYYALGAYPMLLAAGGVWADRVSIKKIWLRYAFVAIILILALPFVPLLLPISSPQKMAAANKKWGWEKLGILKWEDGKNHPLQQDFADMLGWKELAQKTERIFDSVNTLQPGNTTVFCGNYGFAGGLKYYGRSEAFKSKIISGNGSFVLWAPPELRFENLIFVNENLPAEYFELAKQFHSAKVVDSCTNALSRQRGSVIVFLSGASDSASYMLNQYISNKRSRFIR